MKNNFVIKYATQSDLLGMVDTYKGWGKFKGILPNKLCESDTYEDLIKYFDGTNNSRIYVIAKCDGQIVGACYIDLSFAGLSNIRLGDMIVNKDYQGQGIGQAIVEKVIAYAKEKNIKKVWLYTQEELTNAIKLYQKMGFVLEGKLKKHFVNKDCLLFGYIVE